MARNNRYNCDFSYYRVQYPCDLAPFETAFHAVCPDNVLSVNVHKEGNQAMIKAPAGVVSAAIMQTHTDPPVGLVTAPPWCPDPPAVP